MLNGSYVLTVFRRPQNLQSAVQRMEGYVKNIEVMVVESKRK